MGLASLSLDLRLAEVANVNSDCLCAQFCVMPVFSGVLLGYLIYDCVHYAIHHARISHGWLASLKRAHLSHHFRSPRGNFGISSGLFDVLLRTCSAMPQ